MTTVKDSKFTTQKMLQHKALDAVALVKAKRDSRKPYLKE